MVTVVAKNYARQDKIEEVVRLFRELVEETRKEEGCIRYELYQDAGDPSILTMIEDWSSRDALEKHFKAEHFTRLVPQIRGSMQKETELNIYTRKI